jgi:hypothetical protein
VSQGLYYDSIVVATLPFKGRFQKLEMGPNGLQTEFGPGDPGYLGGRWWVDANPNGPNGRWGYPPGAEAREHRHSYRAARL